MAVYTESFTPSMSPGYKLFVIETKQGKVRNSGYSAQ